MNPDNELFKSSIMKPLYPILIIIFLFLGVDSTFGQDHPRGKVKSYRESEYEIIKTGGEFKKGKKLVTDHKDSIIMYFDDKGNRVGNYNTYYDIFTSFDINGNETKETYYNSDGSIWKKKVIKRDSTGNIIEEINLDKTIKYKYNESGQVLEETTYYSNGTTGSVKYQYKYDKKTNCTISTSKNTRITYKNGHKIEKTIYSGDTRFEHQYDDNGKIIEDCMYVGKNILTSRLIYKYDDSGNEIECIDQSYYKGRGRVSKYDLNGNKIEEISEKKDGSKLTTTYENTSDIHGNWIKRIVYRNGEPIQWLERTIEYYE